MTQTYGTRQSEFSYLGTGSQAEIVEINHAEALMMDEARGMQVVTVTAGGLTVTRAMVDQEIRDAAAYRTARAASTQAVLVMGINASSNMFA